MKRARHELSKLALLLIGLALLVPLPAQAQSVSLLSYSNIWTNVNLGGAPGGVEEGMIAFNTTPNNQLHLYYAGLDYHIHQRYPQVRSGLTLWVDEDLTKETGAAPMGFPGLSGVTGFSQQNFQYVYYEDANCDIHQMFYNNVGWVDQDITVLAKNAVPGICDGLLLALTTTPNNQIHVYYGGGPDGDIHQLFFNGSSWADENLTLETGGAMPMQFGLAGFTVGNYQYFFYVDNNGHVHETFYNNISWRDLDLTAQTGAPLTTGCCVENLAALIVSGSGTLDAYYVAANNHLIEMASPDNIHWTYLDLTARTNGPGASQFDKMLAFTTGSNARHLYYTAAADPSHVNQLFFNGTSWSNEDLSAETHGPATHAHGGMGGFAIGNDQYVFYSTD